MNRFIENLLGFADRERVLPNEPMANHTTFRAGGKADVLFYPKSAEEIAKARALAKDCDVPVTLLGCGSNVLVRDEGIRGAVIVLGKPFSAVEVKDNVIRAQAGARLSAVANAALAHGLTGLEFASGIPGSVGGGVFMNAGAYGGELSNVIREVTLLRNGAEVCVPVDEMGFGYRHSAVMGTDDWVTGAVFALQPGDPAEIRATMNDLNGRRRDKQPLEYASAGSTFKRPTGYFAGTLIEQAGLKGYRVGDAMVSEKHAGFVVNVGSASASDILAVMAHVQQTVMEKFGVMLEPEVQIL